MRKLLVGLLYFTSLYYNSSHKIFSVVQYRRIFPRYVYIGVGVIGNTYARVERIKYKHRDELIKEVLKSSTIDDVDKTLTRASIW